MIRWPARSRSPIRNHPSRNHTPHYSLSLTGERPIPLAGGLPIGLGPSVAVTRRTHLALPTLPPFQAVISDILRVLFSLYSYRGKCLPWEVGTLLKVRPECIGFLLSILNSRSQIFAPFFQNDKDGKQYGA
ncbi:hypothetical protein NPIL_559021 [Nephila pilipes]|uniref:Uncharacterized protein n=1 Tax=Nephila pilipes TaxID=299642 RepID=A0A8X6NA37_NEPPI|nr:hypothetical protein NPIL_559021 [Nephila pilipes]